VRCGFITNKEENVMNVYEKITNQIMEQFEQGTVPWRRPWRSRFPRNLVSGKTYRGINVLMLGMSGHPPGRRSTRGRHTKNQVDLFFLRWGRYHPNETTPSILRRLWREAMAGKGIVFFLCMIFTLSFASTSSLAAKKRPKPADAEAASPGDADSSAQPAQESADQPECEQVGGKARYIGPAKSFLPMFFPSPVIVTQISLIEGVVYETFDMEDVFGNAITGRNDTFTAQLAGYGQQLGLGVKFLDWFGVDLRAQGFAATGLDGNSIMYIGALGGYQVGGILKFQVFEMKENPGFKITLGLRGEYGSQRIVMPAHLLAGLMHELGENADVNINDLGKYFQKYLMIWSDDLTVAPALMVGLGVTKYFSALAYVDFGYYRSTLESGLIDQEVTSSFGSQLGIDLTLDLGPVFPLAIQGEYSTTLLWYEETNGKADQGTTAPDKHNVGAGLYYSGLTDLQIGIAGYATLYTGKDANNQQQYEGDFCFRYFF
jgi:hypothetical protein